MVSILDEIELIGDFETPGNSSFQDNESFN